MTNAADFFNQTLAQNPEAGKSTFDDSPLPEGRYPLVVESCELRKYVDGVKRSPDAIAEACAIDATLVPGDEVSITYVVTEGKFIKRKLFGSYCITAASNQKTYGEFTPQKKEAAGRNDLCGLMLRLGRPTEWADWTGKMFNGYVTAKKGKDGKIRNDVRCVIKPGEENAPAPSVPDNTTAHRSDEAPF